MLYCSKNPARDQKLFRDVIHAFEKHGLGAKNPQQMVGVLGLVAGAMIGMFCRQEAHEETIQSLVSDINEQIRKMPLALSSMRAKNSPTNDP